jgi:peptide/nickel transport system substrate-binding protein
MRMLKLVSFGEGVPVRTCSFAFARFMRCAVVMLVGLASMQLTQAHAQTQAQTKVLRFSLSDDATTLDPHATNLAINGRFLNNVYEGLVMRDKDFNVAPSLALSWTQPDAKTWRFKLRPNVKFHEGSAFTADDVVFSVSRALHPLSYAKWTLQGVASAKRVDDLTVDLVMAEPNPVLLLHLCNFAIMSKSWSAKHNVIAPQNYNEKEETFAARNANGTGPFMVVSRQPDVKTVLALHKQWWNRGAADRGNLTGVEWVPIKSNSTRMAALMSGSVDFVADPPVQDRDRLKSLPGINLQVGSEARVIFLAFDVWRDALLYSNVKGKNPFKDLRVRQAIAHAIDAELIVKKVMRGYGRPTALIIGREAQGYAADLDRRLPVDVPRAKKLMAEAGYVNGFEVTMDCLNQTPFGEICQAVASQLAAVGIKLKLNMVAFTNAFQQFAKYDTGFYVMGFGAPTMDAYSPLLALVQSADRATGSGESNWGRYNNPKVNALMGRIRVEPDMPKRNAMIREVLTMQRDDLAVLPVFQSAVAWAMRSNVTAPYLPNNYPYWYRFSIQ